MGETYSYNDLLSGETVVDKKASLTTPQQKFFKSNYRPYEEDGVRCGFCRFKTGVCKCKKVSSTEKSTASNIDLYFVCDLWKASIDLRTKKKKK